MARRFALSAAALALAVGGCAKPAPTVDEKAIEKAAHGAYVDAINANDIDRLMAVLTDDVVYQSPHAPELIGKKGGAPESPGTGWAPAFAGARGCTI